jgi:chemotaxis protein methyltransferase CheR
VPPGRLIDCKVLATDVDSGALDRARAASYGPGDRAAVAAHPTGQRWFEPTADGGVQPTAELRRMVFVRSLNLMGDWPMSGPIDVIFCRNVAIYFSPETQRRLYGRMAGVLAPGGVLITGHSESMPRNLEQFEAVGQTIYRVVDRPGTNQRAQEKV